MFLKLFKNNINSILTILGVCLFLVAVSFNYVNYYENKDFIMNLESACDPAVESCFQRDCSTDECPPNNLEIYKKVDVSASFFATCSENSCTKECLTKPNSCDIVFCNPESDEDVCFSGFKENDD
ncbi:MAG: hypothetical protein KBD10_01660 [Candidatus Pacebacteria bacterium]|nr:hypothetical protein [Candidatus Paceibacterota bacterium]